MLRRVFGSAALAALLSPLAGLAAQESAAGPPSVVEVTARDFAFDAPDEVPSGWVTFRLENAGQQEHFLYLGRLPDGRTFSEYEEEIPSLFNRLWGRYEAGELDRAGFKEAFLEQAPEWFASAGVRGGPGIVAPGRTAQATVHLEPGHYWMECYIKTPEGVYHTNLGMVRPFTVTEEPTGASAPEGDLEITVANGELEVSGTPGTGEQTVAVHFGERPAGALFLGNDVHLARLEDGAGTDELARWIDAWRLEGFRAPAPAEFLGGVQDRPAGDTAYFTVDLEPGRYAWIVEAPTDRTSVQTFTVD